MSVIILFLLVNTFRSSWDLVGSVVKIWFTKRLLSTCIMHIRIVQIFYVLNLLEFEQDNFTRSLVIGLTFGR